jgi:hypothetical protein
MMLLLSIGGFIIVFSVIINILLQTGLISWVTNVFTKLFLIKAISIHSINSIFCGMIELTTGTFIESQLHIPLMEKLAVISFLIGWSGLCIHLQVISVISSSDIKPYTYLIGKSMQAIFSLIYMIIGFLIYHTLTASSVSFINGRLLNLKYISTLTAEMLVIVIIINILSLMYICLRRTLKYR